MPRRLSTDTAAALRTRIASTTFEPATELARSLLTDWLTASPLKLGRYELRALAVAVAQPVRLFEQLLLTIQHSALAASVPLFSAVAASVLNFVSALLELCDAERSRTSAIVCSTYAERATNTVHDATVQLLPPLVRSATVDEVVSFAEDLLVVPHEVRCVGCVRLCTVSLDCNAFVC